MPYFFIQKLSYVAQGPLKKYDPVTGFDVLSVVGESIEGWGGEPACGDGAACGCAVGEEVGPPRRLGKAGKEKGPFHPTTLPSFQPLHLTFTPPYFRTGNAYAGRRNSEDKAWQQAAYTEEIAGPATDELEAVTAAANGSVHANVSVHNGASHNGNGNGFKKGAGKKKTAVAQSTKTQAVAAVRPAPLAQRPTALRAAARPALGMRAARMALV